MSLKLKNTEKYLKKYTETLLNRLVYETSRIDRTRTYKSGTITGSITATGKLEQSFEINHNKKKNTFDLLGNSYGEAVDEGTTSSNPPIRKLINWLISKNKTLKDSKNNTIDMSDFKKVRRVAFAIQKSLKLQGIQKTGFISKTIKDEFIKLNTIYNPIIKDIELDLDNILLRAGYKKTGKETYLIEKQINK